MAADGLSNPEIAERLDLSPRLSGADLARFELGAAADLAGMEKSVSIRRLC